MKFAILLALAALLMVPATLILAGVPSSADLETAEAPPQARTEAPPQAAEAPDEGAMDADLDLELLGQPEFQRRIRVCTEQEAASISCSQDCCLYISNMPRCFC